MKRREEINLNITPLIDIIFILFTFFLVATTMKKENNKLNIVLPKSKYFTEINKKNTSILLSKKDIKFNSKLCSLKELDKILKSSQDNKIDIYIDKDVSYEKISKLLDLLSKNNKMNISFINSKLK